MNKHSIFLTAFVTLTSVSQGYDFKFDTYLGFINLDAHEIVYDDNKLLSQLDWSTNASPTLGTHVSAKVSPYFSFHLKGAFSANGNGELTDYDWDPSKRFGRTLSFENWTHRSIHTTELDYYFNVDLHGSYKFYNRKFNKDNLDILANFGYQRTQAEWSAVGGTYTYSVNGFRDTTGTSANGVGINYKQIWDTIYVGATAKYKKDKSTYQITPSIGLSDASDRDIHVNRSLTFNERLDKESNYYLGLNAKYTYDLAKNLQFHTIYEYEKHLENKGAIDLCTSYACYHINDDHAAGAKFSSNHFAVGLTLKN